MGKNIFKYPLLYVQNVQLTQSQKECVIPNKKSNLSCKREMNENLILMGNYHLEEKKNAWGNTRDKWEEKVGISIFFYIASKLL